MLFFLELYESLSLGLNFLWFWDVWMGRENDKVLLVGLIEKFLLMGLNVLFFLLELLKEVWNLGIFLFKVCVWGVNECVEGIFDEWFCFLVVWFWFLDSFDDGILLCLDLWLLWFCIGWWGIGGIVMVFEKWWLVIVLIVGFGIVSYFGYWINMMIERWSCVFGEMNLC